MFDFDPAEHREAYATQGWVHIPNAVSADFLDALRGFVAESLGERRVEGRSIGGSKDQALFEFPEWADYPGELFDAIASMCGLRRAGMTLSERHVKAYDPDAPPEPTAHKDRFASQVSVGLSIDIPSDSRLVLYPDDQVWPNPFNVSAALLDSLPPAQHPDTALRGAREVEIDDSAGDLVAFAGSAVWHLRRRAAGAVNLYLKMNDFGCDPLGEDPVTEPRRRATVAALAGGSENGSLDESFPIPSRRLDFVSRRYLRGAPGELIEASVWERPALPLSEWDLELLRAIDGERDLAAVVAEVGEPGEVGGVRTRVRELADHEVIDLMSEPLSSAADGARRGP